MPIPRPKPHIYGDAGQWFVHLGSKFMLAFGVHQPHLRFPSHPAALEFVRIYLKFRHHIPCAVYIWLRDHKTCGLCGSRIYLKFPKYGPCTVTDASLSIDHIIPVSEGTPHDATDFNNLRATHKLCNYDAPPAAQTLAPQKP